MALRVSLRRQAQAAIPLASRRMWRWQPLANDATRRARCSPTVWNPRAPHAKPQKAKLSEGSQAVSRPLPESGTPSKPIPGSSSARERGHVLRRLESNLFPAIGATPIAELTAPSLLAALRRIEHRGAHDLAHRVLQVSGQVFALRGRDGPMRARSIQRSARRAHAAQGAAPGGCRARGAARSAASASTATAELGDEDDRLRAAAVGTHLCSDG